MPKKRTPTLASVTIKDAVEFYEGVLNRVRLHIAKQIIEYVQMTDEQFAVFQDYFITKVSWNVELLTPLGMSNPSTH
jgi:hypothetical protein